MKKMTFLSLFFAVAVAGLTGSIFAADEIQDAYAAYQQKAAPIEQQLYAKQAELDALYANPQPDTAKAQHLFREIGDLEGQLFAAGVELRSRLSDSDTPYMGRHHPGEFSTDGYMGRGMGHGGYMGHRGGNMRHGGGHHSGW